MASKSSKASKGKRKQPRTGISKPEEAYCRAYVLNGGNGAEALFEAMPHTRKWTPHRRAVRSSKLQAKGKIRERVAELTQIVRRKANEAFAMTAEETIARLTMLARGTLRDFVRVDEEGRLVSSLANVTDEQAYCLQEVMIEDIVDEPGARHGGVDLAHARLWVKRLKNSLSVEHPIAGDELRHQAVPST
jgi:hypothetical protein